MPCRHGSGASCGRCNSDSVEPDYGLTFGSTFGCRVEVLQVHEILAAPGCLLHRTQILHRADRHVDSEHFGLGCTRKELLEARFSGSGATTMSMSLVARTTPQAPRASPPITTNLVPAATSLRRISSNAADVIAAVRRRPSSAMHGSGRWSQPDSRSSDVVHPCEDGPGGRPLPRPLRLSTACLPAGWTP